MQKMILVLVFGLAFTVSRGQSILQLTEQLAYDAEQLAAMKSTLQEMYQGYADLKNGLTNIRDIARNTFDLHKGFLDALWVLSPGVRGDPRLAAIAGNAGRIVAGYRSGTARIAGTSFFTAAEVDYVNGTFDALLQHCNQALEELTMVTTDNTLRMSDEQRLEAVDRIDGEIKSQLGFLEELNSSLAVETARRQKEAADLHTLKILYGLP